MTIKVALLGLGRVGAVHSAAYPKVAAIELTAVSDANFERVKKFRGHKKLKRFKTDKEAVEDPAIDMLDICAPTYVHKKLIIEGLRAGKHIFCEKPFARSVTEAREILREAKKSKKKVMIGYVCRFQDVNQKIKALLDDGRMGKPGVVRASRCIRFPGRWHGDFEKSGGAIFGTGLHDIDLLRWFLGDIRRVYARRSAGLKDSNIDYALISLRFSSGVIGHIETSWAEIGKGYNTFDISGDKGLIHYDSRTSAAINISARESTEQDGNHFTDSPSNIDPIVKEIYHFVQCVETDKSAMVGPEDAVKNIEVAEAAISSSKTGRPVTLKNN